MVKGDIHFSNEILFVTYCLSFFWSKLQSKLFVGTLNDALTVFLNKHRHSNKKIDKDEL